MTALDFRLDGPLREREHRNERHDQREHGQDERIRGHLVDVLQLERAIEEDNHRAVFGRPFLVHVVLVLAESHNSVRIGSNLGDRDCLLLADEVHVRHIDVDHITFVVEAHREEAQAVARLFLEAFTMVVLPRGHVATCIEDGVDGVVGLGPYDNDVGSERRSPHEKNGHEKARRRDGNERPAHLCDCLGRHASSPSSRI